MASRRLSLKEKREEREESFVSFVERRALSQICLFILYYSKKFASPHSVPYSRAERIYPTVVRIYDGAHRAVVSPFTAVDGPKQIDIIPSYIHQTKLFFFSLHL